MSNEALNRAAAALAVISNNALVPEQIREFAREAFREACGISNAVCPRQWLDPRRDGVANG